MKKKQHKLFLVVISITLIFLHWFSDSVKPNNLFFKVTPLYPVLFFETRYLYALMHLVPLIPILALSFDTKVAFYKTWKYLFPALFIVAVPFWIWDIAKTARGVWGFNPNYYTLLFFNLPIEEWLFFITFPWASVFIYLCLNAYFPKGKLMYFLQTNDKVVTYSLIIFFYAVGFIFWGRLYTVTTFWFAATVLMVQNFWGDALVRAYFYRAFLIATIPFILINSVFTGAFTRQPIVVYNPEEYLGIRFGTIPFDDFSYNFALMLGVVSVFEYLRKQELLNSYLGKFSRSLR